MKNAFSVSAEQCLRELNSRQEGLSNAEVQERLAKFGPNQISSGKKFSPITLFIEQFFQRLFLLFLAITIPLSITIWDKENKIPEAVFIFIWIFTDAILGFILNYKAARGMEALKNMVVPKTTVKREGKQEEVEATSVVPGDIIVLSEGMQVPADARLLSAHALKADESAFTGESVPVNLKTEELPENTSLQDRKNIAYMGTYITQGEGEAVVTDTGMNTELGKRMKSGFTNVHDTNPFVTVCIAILVFWLCFF